MSETTKEVLTTLNKVLLRCWILWAGLQIITFGAVLTMGDMVHYFHAMFGLSIHDSHLITAGYLGMLKLLGAMFFVVWLAIWLVLRKN